MWPISAQRRNTLRHTFDGEAINRLSKLSLSEIGGLFHFRIPAFTRGRRLFSVSDPFPAREDGRVGHRGAVILPGSRFWVLGCWVLGVPGSGF